jgi:hypothetical protein
MTIEFKPWPKITRIEKKRPTVFTEKLDGTNACIVISKEGEFGCQSRSRLITPDDDNYGFARWAYSNKEDLIKNLGPGYHFGEWWGNGIQRGYGLNTKKFSLFNTRRWGEHNPPPCGILWVPIIRVNTVEEAITFLKENGSLAVPGWTKPEGAVMYEPDTDTCFKIIMDK